MLQLGSGDNISLDHTCLSTVDTSTYAYVGILKEIAEVSKSCSENPDHPVFASAPRGIRLSMAVLMDSKPGWLVTLSGASLLRSASGEDL
jgi:hypothetical protein